MNLAGVRRTTSTSVAAALATVVAVFGPGTSATAAKAEFGVWTWWEAETPSASNFPTDNPFHPQDKQAARALSNGNWIGAEHPGKVLFLEYRVSVPKDARYDFYARKFWHHGPFRWRFDDQGWQECGADAPLLDDVQLAEFVNVNWVHLGAVRLSAGAHIVRIEVDPKAEAVAFDCFVLTNQPFTARGALKPHRKYDTAPDGWFPFEPDSDPFGSASLDLRFLNEREAGDGGVIEARGDAFVHEKTGEITRFWAINVGHDILANSSADLERYARRLAKLGVNLVRLHGPLWRDDDETKIDLAKVQNVQRLLFALKNQGIYLSLSSYFPLWLRPKATTGFEGFDGKLNAFGVAFFNETLQGMQKTWLRAALTTKSPYTGLTLVEDPALAMVEIQNEDSLFFWTFAPYRRIPAPQMERVERLFGAWLAAKYGSVERAFARWPGGRVRGDSPKQGRAGFIPIGELAGRRDLRARDTAEFAARLQRQYYDQMYGFLKKELGFRGIVIGSNWVTADPRVLGPLDKWSNAGCDAMDRHGYYGGPHEGARAESHLSVGDRYNDASAILFETGKGRERSFELPLMDLAYNGKPSIVSEINWAPPNRYRADLPPLAAAYGLLQGTDGFVFFASSNLDWAQGLSKFSLADPVAMGQFPAAALIFRRGLVRTAGVSVRIEARLSNLFSLDGIPASAPQNIDGLRNGDIPPGTRGAMTGVGAIDPLAFLTGRVEVNVSDQGGSSRAVDLSQFIDRTKQLVKSTTGELGWDYGRGLVTIDAPAAQGVTGFLSGGKTVVLSDVTITSPMDYGSILLVSLDDLPLRASRRMLLQVMSEDNNFGWSAPGTGLRTITAVGGPPIVVKNFAGVVSLHRPDAASLLVRQLDFNGYDTLRSSRGAQSLTLADRTLYYLIER